MDPQIRLWLCAIVLVTACVLLTGEAADKQVTSLDRARSSQSINKCGSYANTLRKVELCAAPLMDILEGRFKQWPRTNADIDKVCRRFTESEKCIRDISRSCFTGLHRTILSSLVKSMERSRKRECATSNYPALLSTIGCIERNQELLHDQMSNWTSLIQVINHQVSDMHEKTVDICCMVRHIQTRFLEHFRPICEPESEVINRIYHKVMEDVLDLICRSVKCPTGWIYSLNARSMKYRHDGILSAILEVVLTLGGL